MLTSVEVKIVDEREIFLEACEIEELDAQNDFLAQACSGNRALQVRLRALIDLHQTAADFLETPALDQVVISPVNATIALDSVSIRQELVSGEDPQAFVATQGGAGDFRDRTMLHFLQPSTKSNSLGRFEKYDILEVVGRGAFGIVLKAFDEVLRRIVAIKVMSPDLVATPEARKRFLREARSSAAVRHENVVQIHAVSEQPIPHLVMEFIPGQTIQQRVDQRGPLEITESVRLAHQIALGLTAAHATGLIHRDIKPSNILLESGSDRVKITDFGLARAVDDPGVTQSGFIAGTPMYMSPEQVLGEPLDFRTDLFSLGGVLYFMLSGRTPFQATSTVAILKRVSDETPRPLSEIRSQIPEWLTQIVSKLHARRPENRFDSAAQVAHLLERCLSELQRGKTPSVPDCLAKELTAIRRNRGLAVAGVLLAIGVSFVASNSFRRELNHKSPGELKASRPDVAPVSAEIPIDLGTRLTPENFDDGSMSDVSFDEETKLLVLNPGAKSRNLWISFRDLASRNLSIETRIRIRNPDRTGFVKFIFKQYPHTEAFMLIGSAPGGNKVWINDAIHQGWEKTGVFVSQFGSSNWMDLKFDVSTEKYSVWVDGEAAYQIPREDLRPGYIAIGGDQWCVEMQNLRVTIHEESPHQ